MGLTAERPWPGLASYAEADRSFFFGREAEAVELHRLVRAEPLAVLFSISGLGKTSLLNAGLFPRLRAVGWLPVLVRLDFAQSAPPLAGQVLNAAARSADKSGIVVPQWRENDTLWQAFHRRGQLFWGVTPEPATPVLVLDQFEECFTLGQADHTIRHTTDFLAQLSDLVENRAPPEADAPPSETSGFTAEAVPLRVVLSLREDYLAALEALRNLFSGLHRARLRLLPFTAVQTRKVVECPGSGLLARGAVDAILDTFLPSGADATDSAVDPALLSLFCWQFNEQRLAAGLQHLEADRIVGSRERILRDFYSSAFAGVENSEAVQRWVEESLVDAGGYRASRSWNDALATSGVTASALNMLITRRLLHPFDRPGAPTQLELTHDRLCAVVVERREARRTAEAKVAAEARAATELEKQRIALGRARQTTLGFALLSLLALGALAVAVIAWYRAEAATQQVKIEKERTEQALVLVKNREKAAEEAKQRAVASKNAADELINFMQYDLRDTLGKLGQLRMMEDINARIRRYHEEHPAEAGDAAARDAADRERSVALEQQGDILRDQGRLAEALKAYRDSLEIRESLTKKDPDNTLWQRDLSLSYDNVGNVQSAQGDLAGALKSYRDSLGIREKLAKQDPDNAGWQSDLAVELSKSRPDSPERSRRID